MNDKISDELKDKIKKAELYLKGKETKEKKEGFAFDRGILPILIPLWVAVLGYGWLPDSFSSGGRIVFYTVCVGAFFYFLINTIRHMQENSPDVKQVENELDSDLDQLIKARKKKKVEKQENT